MQFQKNEKDFLFKQRYRKSGNKKKECKALLFHVNQDWNYFLTLIRPLAIESALASESATTAALAVESAK